MAVRLSLWLWTLSIAMFISFTSADDSHGAGAPFSYAGPTGPDHWGSLDELYAACSNGKQQSPIDIKNDIVAVNPDLKPLEKNYTAAHTTLVNNGYNIAVRFGEDQAGGINLNGKYYPLKQMHWHIPSEHLIEGKRYAAELHLVHVAQDGSISAVAMLYNLGEPDATIKEIEEQLRILAKNESKEVALGTWRMNSFDCNYNYYRYNGSLTSPPCTGNLIWNIIEKEWTISKEQVKLLQSPLGADFKYNSRPAQPLNGRKVELYHKNE